MAVSVAIRPRNLKPPIIKVGFFIINKTMKIDKIILGVIIIVLGVSFCAFKPVKTVNPLGQANTGMMTIVASSTYAVTVGPLNAVTLFSARSDCTNRKITTYAQPIMITFATSTDSAAQVRASGTLGHLQAASTTVDYDGGLNGCGLWQAFGFGASTTISVSEFAGQR